MAASSSSTVVVIGAGISGISAAKLLATNGISDFIIVEAANRIGGRMANSRFGGVTVDMGAGWIAGVGGQDLNPIWKLANQCNLRTCFSDYSHARFNIYDTRGNIVPRSVAEASYEVAVNAANRALAVEASGQAEAVDEKESFVPSTPLEFAIDYVLHDFEMAEVEPIPTYTEFGAKEFMVADERGYDYVVHKLAQQFLQSDTNGHIVDDRLKLQKVVREIEYTDNGVTVTTEDGSIYNAKYCIVSASLGVLRSDLITFKPELPKWKTNLFWDCDIRVYTKIFLKFSRKFWPTEEGTEFFLYAHEKRGYYTFWQHMENVYPGSNILMVTVTDEESKRIENQSDDTTKAEIMQVLRNMFGNDIPDAEEILVPKWWNDRFQRGSYTNYPIYVNKKHFQNLKEPVGPIYFAGEHTSEKFNGYVHGAYLSGIDTANMVLENIDSKKKNKCIISYPPPRVSERRKVPVVAGMCRIESATRLQRNSKIRAEKKKKRWVERHNLIAYSSRPPTPSWV